MGRIFRPSYTVKRPDGSAERRRTSWYHVEWTDARGRTRRKKAATTQELAREILRQKENETAKERNFLPTQNAGEILVTDLRDRYLAAQRGRVSAIHLESLTWRLKAVIEGTRAVMGRDLTPERVETFLAELAQPKADEKDNAVEPPGARTINTYLQAVRGMLNWAVAMRILPFNQLACLQPRSKREKRKNRRALTEVEVAALLEAARPTWQAQAPKRGVA